MKNVRIILMFGLLVLIAPVLSAALATGADDEAVALLTDLIRHTRDYTTGAASVASAADCAALINAYGDKLELLKPGMLKLKEKYPDLNTNPPEALKPLVDELTTVMGEMAAASAKLMEYSQDPEVAGATRRIQSIMASGEAQTPPVSAPALIKIKLFVEGKSSQLETISFFAESIAAARFNPNKYSVIDPEEDGEDWILAIGADDIGENQLSYYGSGSSQQIVSLQIKLVNKSDGVVLAGPETEKLEFTDLNRDENTREALENLFNKIISRLER